MILDSSAMVALLFREPEAVRLQETLSLATEIGIGTPTLAETGIVISHRLGRDGRALLGRLVEQLEAVEIPFGERHWREAIGAHQRFGKGRHPAELNFGDCLTYATARLSGRPLLCIGNDFSKTDLLLA